jgi:hypothetical protein
VELGWSPAQFWGSIVADYWAALDWITERNLDQEDDFEAIRSEAKAEAPSIGATAKNPSEGSAIEPVINPNMNLQPRPEWDAWREQIRAVHGY